MIKFSSVKSIFLSRWVPPPLEAQNSTFSFIFHLECNQIALLLVQSLIQCHNHHKNVCKGVSFGMEKYRNNLRLAGRYPPLEAKILNFPPIFFWIIITHVKVNYPMLVVNLDPSGLLRFF